MLEGYELSGGEERDLMGVGDSREQAAKLFLSQWLNAEYHQLILSSGGEGSCRDLAFLFFFVSLIGQLAWPVCDLGIGREAGGILESCRIREKWGERSQAVFAGWEQKPGQLQAKMGPNSHLTRLYTAPQVQVCTGVKGIGVQRDRELPVV